MPNSLYTVIARFLAEHPALPLFANEPDVSPALNKAGVVPCIRNEDGEWTFRLIQPEHKSPDMPPPQFQIAKGSRMYKLNNRWLDSKDRDNLTRNKNAEPEAILGTALREGMEEAGLKLGNIATLYAGKIFPFTSARTGKYRKAYICAAVLKKAEDFNAPDAKQAITAQSRWLTLREAESLARADHVKILAQIAAVLPAA